MLDRLAVLAPSWREKTPADMGVALVELLAYVGDHLSYHQDALATEAYLGTARRRVSVRRHARLVDYFLHDGCNARVLVQIQVGVEKLALEAGLPLSTALPGESRPVVSPAALAQALAEQEPLVFETMHPATLYQAHNLMPFYTWGARECCLPKNATQATLAGAFSHLKAGDILILAETVGPLTGRAEDADPSRRHAVRLNHVWLDEDPLGGRFQDPPRDQPVSVTGISWAPEDALPFPLCLSSRTDEEHGNLYVPQVSMAYGNIVLADHGLTLAGEDLGEVPRPSIFMPPDLSSQRCQEEPPASIPARFRPALALQPLTMGTPWQEKEVFRLPFTALQENDLDQGRLFNELEAAFLQQGITFREPCLSVRGGDGIWSVSDGAAAAVLKKTGEGLKACSLPGPASSMMSRPVAEARPAVTLRCLTQNTLWEPRRDLLASHPEDHHFVVETENDGRAFLRFGDGRHGRRPPAGTHFTATYRVGNGRRGNAGRETLAHLISDNTGLLTAVTTVWNPLPAAGGVEPETIQEVRRDAPQAFRIQERAVTPEDYARAAERHPEVQKAAATFRWTGSWHTVFVSIDRWGGAPVDDNFKAALLAHLEKYRLAGHDLEVNGPLYVPLEIEMLVCVRPDYFRSEVKAALLSVFSNRPLPYRQRGVFHPDNFSFGQPVFLSPLYAAAQAVPGVAWARVTKFQRLGQDSAAALETGKLEVADLEIARLDNDPNYPHRGVFRLTMQGGK
uniref:Putative baseplate assembly protein n=1 Tax=Desulfobacca acetoxidans TaxID=60893 RepID=A0A7V4G7J9_9BACT